MGVEVIVTLAYGMLRPQITCGAQNTAVQGTHVGNCADVLCWIGFGCGNDVQVPLCCCWSQSRLGSKMDRVHR